MNKPKTHNKKRNVGIIYEQLLRKISESIIANDEKRVKLLVEIIKNNFKPGSELYKEFRLFNALVRTKVSSGEIAARILIEARNASRVHNSEQLTREKSFLIKEINHKLQDRTFYTTRIPNYKTYATIQTLINDWRENNSNSTNIARIALYEDQLHAWLLSDKNNDEDSLKVENIDKLAVNIMREKLNKKYSGSLTESQTSLLREHIFLTPVSTDNFTDRLKIIKNDANRLLRDYEVNCSNKFVKDKIPDIKNLIESLDPDDHCDDNIVKYMTILKLCDEIMEKENG